MLSITVITLTTLALLNWGGFRLTTFCTLLLAIWAISVQLINGENSLLFGIWLFFVALNVMDINASKAKKGEFSSGSDVTEQNNLNFQVKRYKQALKDDLDDDFE